jgi:hypothetical protein
MGRDDDRDATFRGASVTIGLPKLLTVRDLQKNVIFAGSAAYNQRVLDSGGCPCSQWLTGSFLKTNNDGYVADTDVVDGSDRRRTTASIPAPSIPP